MNVDIRYWRIGVDYVFLDLFEQGYPYVWGSAISGYLNGKERGRLAIGNIARIQPGHIIVCGGTKNIDYIGKAEERPAYLFEKDGCAKGKSFENDFGVQQANDTIKSVFRNFFAKKDVEQSDIVCIKTKWWRRYTRSHRLKWNNPQNLVGASRISNMGACLEITRPEIIDFIDSKLYN